MYLAKIFVPDGIHYIIRESYRKGDRLLSRDLFDLGNDPREYIVYPGGNSYYIHESVEEALETAGVTSIHSGLEQIFFPYLKPRVQRVIEPFLKRSKSCRRENVKKKANACEQSQFHIFDKRRIHFLKFGRMDQGYIGQVSHKLFMPIFDKSRDEIEQYLMENERILKEGEKKPYVYTIFNLQRHFTQPMAKTDPAAIPEEEIDERFMENICRLNEDPAIWGEENTGNSLNEYLIRYATMYFDSDFETHDYLGDYIREFMNSHRRQRTYPQRKTVSHQEMSEIFQTDKESLQTMNRVQVTRLYRKLALKLHPDQGGNETEFIRLTEAYQDLIRSKK